MMMLMMMVMIIVMTMLERSTLVTLPWIDIMGVTPVLCTHLRRKLNDFFVSAETLLTQRKPCRWSSCSSCMSPACRWCQSCRNTWLRSQRASYALRWSRQPRRCVARSTSYKGQVKYIEWKYPKTFRSELYHTQTYSTPCGSTIVLKKFQPALPAYRSLAQAIHMIQQPSPDAVGVKKGSSQKIIWKRKKEKGYNFVWKRKKWNKSEEKKQTFVWKNHQGPVSHSP